MKAPVRNTTSAYTVSLIVLYIAALPFLWIFGGHWLRYDIASNNEELAILITVVCAALFVVALHRLRTSRISGIGDFAPAILYGIMFAVPEEIIFRATIQTAFDAYLMNAVLAVFCSSIVFGLAHLPNGAKGMRWYDWNWKFAGLAFLGGIPLGTIFALTGSLTLPTVLHAFFVASLRLTE